MLKCEHGVSRKERCKECLFVSSDKTHTLPDEAELVETVVKHYRKMEGKLYPHELLRSTAKGIITALRPHLSSSDDKARIAELEAANKSLNSDMMALCGVLKTRTEQRDALREAKKPCGECYLQQGETCNICGAVENDIGKTAKPKKNIQTYTATYAPDRGGWIGIIYNSKGKRIECVSDPLVSDVAVFKWAKAKGATQLRQALKPKDTK